MPRPRKFRHINFEPDVTYFKPAGIRLQNLEEVTISFEEIEALRLQNSLELNQEDASKMMQISQPTYFRMIKEARKKITDALVNGKAIKLIHNNKKERNIKP